MTNRLVIGIDPGLTGAIVAVADGVAASFDDMPTRKGQTQQEVDSVRLAGILRGIRQQHSGASIHCAMERVMGRNGWGATQSFRFGEGFGRVKGVLEALGIEYRLVQPAQWKRHHGLLGTRKEAARCYAIEKWPELEPQLRRMRDHGRADALLIAIHHNEAWIG